MAAALKALTAAELLEVWERGRDRPPAEQALVLLAAALPEARREDLARLSVGERDAYLLALRERTLGRTLQGRTDCPSCGARLELRVPAADLHREQPVPLAEREVEVEAAGHRVRARLPTGEDLLAVDGCADASQARALLLARTLIAASRGSRPVAAGDLPEPVVEALAAAIEERDPQALVELRLTCARCQHSWLAVLDVGAFFWAELQALAERLMYDVDTLARAYGWSEREVLAMSAARRRAYVDRQPVETKKTEKVRA